MTAEEADNSREREIAALRKEQEALRAQFTQEIAVFRQHLAEEIAKLRREQGKSAEGTSP
jgi:hypothetical protein